MNSREEVLVLMKNCHLLDGQKKWLVKLLWAVFRFKDFKANHVSDVLFLSSLFNCVCLLDVTIVRPSVVSVLLQPSSL